MNFCFNLSKALTKNDNTEIGKYKLSFIKTKIN